MESWISEIKDNTDDDVLVYLVGNRIDLVEERQVSSQEGQQCMGQKKFNNFCETSAMTGENVRETFETLAKHLYLTHKNKLHQYVRGISQFCRKSKRSWRTVYCITEIRAWRFRLLR